MGCNEKFKHVMDNQIEIYQESDGQTQIEVKFEEETVWLDAHALASIYIVQRPAIVKHINIINKSKKSRNEDFKVDLL